MRRISVLGFVLVCLLTAAGCRSRVNHEWNAQLDVGDVKSVSLNAPAANTKIRVEINATGAPVNAWVMLERDSQAAQDRLLNFQKPEKVLGGKEKVQQEVIEVTIPEKTGFTVMLGSTGKAAQATVKITSQ
jgi:hypothetical protein